MRRSHTHNEGGALFLIRSRKGGHCFEDLNPCISIDEDGIVGF